MSSFLQRFVRFDPTFRGATFLDLFYNVPMFALMGTRISTFVQRRRLGGTKEKALLSQGAGITGL